MRITGVERRALWLVGCTAVLFYALLHLVLGYAVSDQFLFTAADAQEYRAVGSWLLGGPDTQGTLVRPYLYPLLIAASHACFGAEGIWAMQALAWWLTILCVHLAVRRAGCGAIPAWVASSIVMFDLSLFALTYHALTEVIATLLMSGIALHLCTHFNMWRNTRYFIGLVGLTGLLALVKPLFFPLLLIWLLIMGPLLYRDAFRRSPRHLVGLAVVLLPLIAQVTIMAERHQHFGISRIGDATFRNYLFARGYGKIHGLDLPIAIDSVAHLDDGRVRAVILASPDVFLAQYLTHLEDNIYYAGGYTLEMVPGQVHPTATYVMDRMNKFHCILHFLAVIPCWLVVVRLIKRRVFGPMSMIAVLLMITYLVLFSSGLSFWQGDRLILPSIGAWTVLYAVIFRDLFPQRSTGKDTFRTLSTEC